MAAGHGETMGVGGRSCDLLATGGGRFVAAIHRCSSARWLGFADCVAFAAQFGRIRAGKRRATASEE